MRAIIGLPVVAAALLMSVPGLGWQQRAPTESEAGLDLYKISSSVLLAEQTRIQAGNTDPLSTKCVNAYGCNKGYYVGEANKKDGIREKRCREGTGCQPRMPRPGILRHGAAKLTRVLHRGRLRLQ